MEAYALSHYILIFDFSKRLDGCAMTWISLLRRSHAHEHTALSIDIAHNLKIEDYGMWKIRFSKRLVAS